MTSKKPVFSLKNFAGYYADTFKKLAATAQRRSPADDFWRCERCGTPNPLKSYLTNCLGCGATRSADSGSANRAKSTAAPPKRDRRARIVAAISIAYAFAVLAVWVLIRFTAERFWLGTALLYAPRWPWLIPPVVLAFAAWKVQWTRLWLVHIGTLVCGVWLLMNLSFPIDRLFTRTPAGVRIRIMTLNTHSGKIDVKRVADLIESERIDVVCLQELPHPDGPRSIDACFPPSWNHDSQKRIVSRFPIVSEEPGLPRDSPALNFSPVDFARVRMRLPDGTEIDVASPHLPTARFALEKLTRGDFSGVKTQSNWRWKQLGNLVPALHGAIDDAVIVGGDFNMPSDSPMFNMLKRDYNFGFDQTGWGCGYTRPSSFPWIRIDHILATPRVHFVWCRVGPDVGSDHLPLLAEVVVKPKTEPVRSTGSTTAVSSNTQTTRRSYSPSNPE